MSIWDSDDLGAIAQKACWALFGVAAVTCSLRVYCRLKYSPRLGGGLYMDDFITLSCLLFLLVFCILLSVSLPFGVGKHYATLSDANKVAALHWNVVLNALTPWICTLPKFAIIMTLRRILNYGTKTTILFWGLALSSQATVLAQMIWGLVQCQPMAFQWDKSIQGGTCADPNIYIYLAWVTYIYSTVLDVFFALYPVPFVMRLNMPLKTRIGVAVSLSISWVGFAISMYKFSIFPKLGALLGTDPSYPLVYLSMTHAAEGSFLIISTSLATLRPLVRGMKNRVVELSTSSRTPTASRYQFSGTGPSAARTSRSHVDIMEFMLNSRRDNKPGRCVECNSQQDQDDTAVLDSRRGRCVDCGGEISGQQTSTVTWVEMLKG